MPPWPPSTRSRAGAARIPASSDATTAHSSLSLSCSRSHPSTPCWWTNGWGSGQRSTGPMRTPAPGEARAIHRRRSCRAQGALRRGDRRRHGQHRHRGSDPATRRRSRRRRQSSSWRALPARRSCDHHAQCTPRAARHAHVRGDSGVGWMRRVSNCSRVGVGRG